MMNKAVKLIMPRNFTVRTSDGRFVYNFKKDEPVLVAPSAIEECMRFGAIVADGGELPLDDEPVSGDKPAPVGPEREAKILEAIASLVARNGREDFTASGMPQVGALKDILGFKVDTKERNALWDKFLAEQAKLLENED